jgi:uncharacterized membrane protein YvbJ
MYCKNCGRQIDDNADVCLGCGVYTDKGRAMAGRAVNQQNQNMEDVSTNALDIVSFLIPIAGVILGIVYMSTGRPKAGKRYLTIGLVTWGIAFLLIMLMGGL